MRELYIKSRIEADAYDGIVKARTQTKSRVQNLVRDHKISKETAETLHSNIDRKLEEAEKYLLREMQETINELPIYTEFLVHIKGIGPRMTTRLVAYIQDISRFPTVSSLWKYSGLAPVAYCTNCKPTKRYFKTSEEAEQWIERAYQKQIQNIPKGNSNYQLRIENIHKSLENSVCHCNNPEPRIMAERKIIGINSVDYNPKMKNLLYLITEQFVRQGKFYRKLYDQYREEEEAKCPELNKGHLHNRAKRRVGKIFISHTWQKWRELEDLPVTEPYAKSLGCNIIPVPIPDEDGKI